MASPIRLLARRRLRRPRLACAALLLLTVAAALPAYAQDTTRATTRAAMLENARQLRDQHRLADAERVLRALLARDPGDATTERLLAQTLYWEGNRAAAAALYDRALREHPDDADLRLDYGRMLVETGSADEARDVLAPLVDSPRRGADLTLLGTSAYWAGDYTQARDRLQRALAADPAQTDARRQLDEIGELSAPWLRVDVSGAHDNQPIDSWHAGATVGFHPTPNTQITLGGAGDEFRAGDSLTMTLAQPRLGVSALVPGTRLTLALAGGVASRTQPAGAATEWIASADASAPLANGVRIDLRANRAPYTSTIASLVTPVNPWTAGATLSWQRASWLGEAGVQGQWFADANEVGTAYAWLLAPLVSSAEHTLQLGWAAAGQNSGSTRFVLRSPHQTVPPTSSGFDFSGAYAPYYTPVNLMTQSVIAAASTRLAPSLTLRAHGGYAAYARDDAPSFALAGVGNRATLVEERAPRRFSPWDATVGLDDALSPATSLTLEASAMHTAFYTAATMGLRLTHGFGGSAGAAR